MDAPNPNVQRAMILQQQRRYADAEVEWRQAIIAAPQDGRLHSMLAMCLLHRDGQAPAAPTLAEATAEAQQGVGLMPDDAYAHYVYAQTLLARNRLEEATSAAAEAVRLDAYSPDSFALFGFIKFGLRQWQAALDAAEQGLALDPEHANCNNLRAMALVQLGRRSEAGQTIQATLERDPDNPVTHANKGWALLHEGKSEEALHHFREALRLDPTSNHARAGVVEALKAKNFVYRWMLRYFLWMSRLSSGAQWGIILGLYLGNRILAQVADKNPSLAPYLNVILLLYLIFVIMSWLAYPLFNLLLRLNKYGRLALSREQVVSSNWIGATLALGIACFLAFLLLPMDGLLVAAIVFGLLTMPVSAVFSAHDGWPRNAMIGAALVLALMGLGAAGLLMPIGARLYSGGSDAAHELGWSLFGKFGWGILIVTLASNYLRTMRFQQ